MTPERIEEIYNRISGLSVELDNDPASRGPKYMQDLISRTRGYLNEVTVYLQEVHRERHQLESAKEAQEAIFLIRSDELLSSDSRVRDLPAVDDRKAMINVILRDERRQLLNLNRQIKDLGHMEKTLRFRHKELESTMGAIRLQKTLVAMELGTGGLYGDETDTSRGTWGKKTSIPVSDEGSLDDDELLAAVDKAVRDLAEEEKTSAMPPHASDSEDPFGLGGLGDLTTEVAPALPASEVVAVKPQDVGPKPNTEPNSESEVEAFLGGGPTEDTEFEELLSFL